MPPLPRVRVMIRAFMERDASYDGLFLAGVTTTGVFCRPSCAARKPRVEHVRFFASVREAVFAGFRPCLRCRPLDVYGETPRWAARLLDAVAADPGRRLRDADLRRMRLEPATVRRYFLRRYGMTFHAYARARRLSGAFRQLRAGARLDEVIMSNGFDSHSGFRDAFARAFGDAPGRSRGARAVVFTWIDSPLGPLVAGADADRLCLLEFTDRRMLEAQIETVRRRFGCPVVAGDSPVFGTLRDELTAYFDGRLRQFSVPLVAPGTPFQEKVWAALQQIPHGETCSYEALARRVGTPHAQRAVGRANGLNRIAIVIPCHRVVNKDGRLGGYGGQVWRKAALLHLERTGHVEATLPGMSA